MQILKLKAVPVFLLLFANLSAAPINTAPHRPSVRSTQKRDRVIATRSAKGTLKGFEVGDYVHAVIKLENGKEKSFYVGGTGLDYFLALHKDEPLTLTYQIVDSYIPEANGRMKIERLTGASAGKLSSAAWWKKMRARHSFDELDKMYSPAVEKLRLNP